MHKYLMTLILLGTLPVLAISPGCTTVHSAEIDSDEDDSIEQSEDSDTEPEHDGDSDSSASTTFSRLIFDFAARTIRDADLREDLTVVAVPDGLTIEVKADEGESLTVRLICIEPADPASMHTALSELVLGKTLRLERDPDFADEDAEARQQGYVFTGGLNINAELVRRGVANYLGNSTRYAGEFDKAAGN